MKDMIKMVVVLTVLSCVSGGLLASIKNNTEVRIKQQQLEFVKGPAIRDILSGSSNNPVENLFTIEDGELKRDFFVGVFNGKAGKIAFESAGKGGYAGDVGLMVGINVEEDRLVGVSVTTHAETPGMGAKAKDEPTYVSQFKGLPIDKPIKVTNDGGSINAISGATITSRAVCNGTNEAVAVYNRLKPQLTEKLKEFK